jgi:hypothetical protein
MPAAGENACAGPALKGNVDPSRRLLSLAAIRDGMNQGTAAKIGGMDRRQVRCRTARPAVDESVRPRDDEAMHPIAQRLAARWRRIDLKRVIANKFSGEFMSATSELFEQARRGGRATMPRTS